MNEPNSTADSDIKNNNWIKNIKLWGTGIGSYYIFSWAYDYVIVSFFLLYLGFLRGMIVVVILSMIVDYATMKFYDWFKKDWLALESIKKLEDKKDVIGKLFRFVRGKGVVLTIIILSLTSNAFIVTAYVRKGINLYNGLSRRDWIVFFTSSILTNIYWIFVIGGGIELFKYIYKLIFI